MKTIDSGMEARYLTKVAPMRNHHLLIEFQDGLSGEIDMSYLLERGGVFNALKDPDFFQRVTLDEYGAPCWPGELDIAPDTLYENLLKALQTVE